MSRSTKLVLLAITALYSAFFFAIAGCRIVYYDFPPGEYEITITETNCVPDAGYQYINICKKKVQQKTP
jgi:hypothetical protein